MSVKVSTHTKTHPHELLLQVGNGWGGHVYLNATQARRLARKLDELADQLRSSLMAELLADDGVVV